MVQHHRMNIFTSTAMKNMENKMNGLNKYNSLFIALVTLLFINVVRANILFSHEGDSIFYDAANNKYTLTYTGDDGRINEITWTPPSDISVEVEAKYKFQKDGNIEYSYEIKVDNSSNQPLTAFRIYTIADYEPILKTPDNWKVILRDSFAENDPGKWVNWYTSTSPVEQGSDIDGFEIVSMALPVYDGAYTEGQSGIITFPDYGPNHETQMYWQDNIVAKHFMGKSINTAAPLIPIYSPPNIIQTYAAFHDSLLEYIEKKYIDESISQNITETSIEILSALSNNLTSDALIKLKELHQLIEGVDGTHDTKKEKDSTNKNKMPLINKEVRKIIKFNIKYFMHQLKDNSSFD